MSTWPETMKVGPIGEWPGVMTPRRTLSPFSANITSTLTLLKRELRELGAKNVEMLIAVPPGAFRIDGRPYANAKPDHPGIILSFETKLGHLSYPADAFTSWQDNLRAIALSLEALRKVDRYGVTKSSEQYRGFLAIEATAAPAGFATTHDAQQWLKSVAGYDPDETWTRRIFREAQHATHPDQGGDPDVFHRVSLAEAKLREAGVL